MINTLDKVLTFFIFDRYISYQVVNPLVLATSAMQQK